MSEDLSRIESLKRKLYMTKDPSKLPTKKEGILHPVKLHINQAWDSTKDTTMKTAKVLGKRNRTIEKVFLASLVIFLGAVLYAVLVFTKGSNLVSNNNIDLSVIGNAFTPGGEPIVLQVSVTNRNNSGIELADVILEYPKDRSGSSEIVRLRKQIGTIESGKTINVPFDITLYGEQGSIKDIKASLEYRVSNSNALFVKDTNYSITLSTAPLLLSLDGPTTVSPNQSFSFNIKATSNTSVLSKKMIIRVDYPTGFSFTNSSITPSVGNNVFDLGDLVLGSEKNITISGTLSGENSDERTFRVYAGEQNENAMDQVGVMYNSSLYTVKVDKPLFSASFSMGGSLSDTADTYTISGGSAVSGSIVWANNSPSRLLNAQIEVSLSGDALDPDSVKVEDGLYNQQTGTFYFNRDTSKDLAVIDPGDSGRFQFSFNTRSSGPNGQSLSNPQIQIEVRTASLLDSGSGDSISSIDRKTIKLGSDLALSSSVLYGTGAFADSGPNPPAQDKKTTYTIVWTVTNNTNPVTGAVVRAVLPQSVDFVGTTSPKNEPIEYNQITKEVKWNVGSVKKSGGGGLTRQVSFQISITPTINQVGQVPKLVGVSTLSATDTFTGNTIKVSQEGLTTESIPGISSGKITK